MRAATPNPSRICRSSSISRSIAELPQPRPAFEIFVYSPRVEGVHLRMGQVARGGIRWSDRREDFRTEVLGLMKAQNVKNTLIVPVGAKGGFVPKRLPPNASREDMQREGVECYRTFIRGLLDVTDNIVERQGRAAAASRASRRRRSVSGRRRRQGHGDVLRHRQSHRRRIRLLAGRCVRLRRLRGLRPQEDGHHRARRLGMREAPLPRDGHRHAGAGLHRRRHRRHGGRRVRQRHAAVAAHPPARGVQSSAHLPRSESRRRARASPSASACSRCRARPGRTTTASCISKGGGIYPRSAKSIRTVARRRRRMLGLDARHAHAARS